MSELVQVLEGLHGRSYAATPEPYAQRRPLPVYRTPAYLSGLGADSPADAPQGLSTAVWLFAVVLIYGALRPSGGLFPGLSGLGNSMGTYKIVRHYADGRQRVMHTGLTLAAAQAHCNDPETSSRTARGKTRGAQWFDGYTLEVAPTRTRRRARRGYGEGRNLW